MTYSHLPTSCTGLYPKSSTLTSRLFDFLRPTFHPPNKKKMSLHDVVVGLLIFFPVLTTITVGLRLFVRTRLCKGAFGWDDVALVVTYVSPDALQETFRGFFFLTMIMI